MAREDSLVRFSFGILEEKFCAPLPSQALRQIAALRMSRRPVLDDIPANSCPQKRVCQPTCQLFLLGLQEIRLNRQN